MALSLSNYITDSADGVLLWAHSVASLASDYRGKGSLLAEISHRVENLPNEMINFYNLKGIPEILRQEIYIMLQLSYARDDQ